MAESAVACERRRTKPQGAGIPSAASQMKEDARSRKLFVRAEFLLKEKQVEKLFAMLPTTGEAEEGGRQLPVAKRRFRASFGRSRPLEHTVPGAMLCAQRSRFFACGRWRVR
ncbi:unnamed protein product [Coccothraustes coccothraustes]